MRPRRVGGRGASLMVGMTAFLLVASLTSLGPAVLSSPAYATSSVSSLKAQATHLSEELIQEQLQVGGYEQLYNVSLAKVAQDQSDISETEGRIGQDKLRITADRQRLTQQALSSYINSGSSEANSDLSVLDGGGPSANREEYEQVATGDLQTTIDQLHTDQGTLQTYELVLKQREVADSQAESEASKLTGQAQSTENELVAQQGEIKGQLAAAMQQAQAVQTSTVTAVVDAASGADALNLTDPPLNAFLQCVVQAESGGNYSAVSANGMYMGAFQFSQSTWNEAAMLASLPQLVGVPPNEATKAEQDTLAVALYAADGEQPWYDPCTGK